MLDSCSLLLVFVYKVFVYILVNYVNALEKTVQILEIVF